jgi:tRNA-Thr(GGU) m(6)t(6)A37 methyltransferase TsaA
LCSQKIEIRPIGFVKRASPEEDVTDKSLVSEIVLEKGFAKALDGIEDFSHVFIIFWMHKISKTEKAALQVHPRGRSELPLVGTLADRGPNHPNPFGLTLVEVIKCRENVLWVRGLDAYDRTPVLDIKPYGCPWEVVTDSRAPKWFYEK